ncbi:MAG: class I SAM-dependent methyltransferase [Candidatus Thorarchaeota archaeon]
MTKNQRSKKEEIDDASTAVPFTARLNAYFRAEESKALNPILIDSFAERLAGNMDDYFRKHKRVAGMGDSSLVRSYYIENELLSPWCSAHKKSQIVLFGAGLDTRAYRFSPVKKDSHTIFELDLPIIIRYKEKVLRSEEPLCSLVRIPVDLSDSTWRSKLTDSGFSQETPTFWILEGLVYYIEQNAVISLLTEIAEMSTFDSQLFVDVCVPALADLRWGPYTMHFKWGVSKEMVSSFFASTGWAVSSSFIDDHSHGRDVGQKGLIFVHGEKNLAGMIDSVASSVIEGPQLSEAQLQAFALNCAKKMIPEIEGILEEYKKSPEEGITAYLNFVKSVEPDIRTLATGQKNPFLLGHISPRLLGNPLAIEEDAERRTTEEIESFIVGYLKAILHITYCSMKGLQGEQFQNSSLYRVSLRTQDLEGFEPLHSVLEFLRHELDEFEV